MHGYIHVHSFLVKFCIVTHQTAVAWVRLGVDPWAVDFQLAN